MITAITNIIGKVTDVLQEDGKNYVTFFVKTSFAEYVCKSYSKAVKELATSGELSGKCVAVTGQQEVTGENLSEIELDAKLITFINTDEVAAEVAAKDTVYFLGILGRDPEMRYSPQGKAVTKMSAAVSIGWGDKKRTNWYNCIAWEKQAEQINNLAGKGTKIIIHGTQALRDWTDKNGEARRSVEITVMDYSIVSGMKKDENNSFSRQLHVTPNRHGSNSGNTAAEEEFPF